MRLVCTVASLTMDCAWRIESLQEYVLVAQGRCQVERFLRQADGTWLYSAAATLDDVLTLPSIGCELSLRAVYAKTDVQIQE